MRVSRVDGRVYNHSIVGFPQCLQIAVMEPGQPNPNPHVGVNVLGGSAFSGMVGLPRVHVCLPSASAVKLPLNSRRTSFLGARPLPGLLITQVETGPPREQTHVGLLPVGSIPT